MDNLPSQINLDCKRTNRIRGDVQVFNCVGNRTNGSGNGMMGVRSGHNHRRGCCGCIGEHQGNQQGVQVIHGVLQLGKSVPTGKKRLSGTCDSA
jgi:hypothetical protein